LKRAEAGAILELPGIVREALPKEETEKKVLMKISYSNVHNELRAEVEKQSQHHLAKLNRLLKSYSPDLVHLHGALDKTPRTSEFELSLNLVLPTGTLHATGKGADVRPAVKMAFAEIEVQVKKHQQKLRKDFLWKRKRGRAILKVSEVTSAD
jgi:ribosome-associated translation inhibitor RaiA